MQTFTNFINEADADHYRIGTVMHFAGKPYRICDFRLDPATRQTRYGWGWQAVFVQATATIEPLAAKRSTL